MIHNLRPALRLCGVGLLLLVVTVGAIGSGPASHDIRPGYGVSEIRWLSDYHPALRGTAGDTPIYVMRGEKPGGVLLLLGGTHGGEIAGIMAAVLLVERGTVQAGTVFVIPHANNSASVRNQASASLQSFQLTTASGEVRTFRYGDRRTQVEDQGAPDPEIFVHLPSGLEFEGAEARNLNRNHPGQSDGTLTQQISYALFQLAREESVDVEIDMHESSLTGRLANTLVSHPRGQDIAAFSILDLELSGISLKQEMSSEEVFGLSHREFGDRTDALAFLIESANPGQEPGASAPDVVNDPRSPLAHRVRLQLLTVEAILANTALLEGSSDSVELSFPFALDDLLAGDLGRLLR